MNVNRYFPPGVLGGLTVILPGLRFWVRWNADLQTLRGSIAPFGPVAALWGDERSRYFRFRQGYQTLFFGPWINIFFDQFFFLGAL